MLAAAVGALLLALPSVLPKSDDGGDINEIEELCSATYGVGECRVLLSYAEDGERVVAVAVVCEGADSIEVRQRLTELLSSFYGIGYNRISIERLK